MKEFRWAGGKIIGIIENKQKKNGMRRIIPFWLP